MVDFSSGCLWGDLQLCQEPLAQHKFGDENLQGQNFM